MRLESISGKMKSMMKRALRNGEADLEKAIAQGLPKIAHEPCRYLVTRKFPDADSQAVSEKVEARRSEIATTLEGPVEIIYSPKPGSATDPDRPDEGERLFFSAERVANTGKNAYWGGFLYLCAREAEVKRGIELGACAGLSAYYLASATSMKRLITIEGSAALAEVARDTLAPLGGRATVINALFNDALDDLLPGLDPIDLAYIDGHHEKVATLTYFERLKPLLAPGAVLLFDDISWSEDMREGWIEICNMTNLSHCIDLGVVGLCIWDPDATEAKIWDLRSTIGVSGVGNPHGWEKEGGTIVD